MRNSTHSDRSCVSGYVETKIGVLPSNWDVVSLAELSDPSAPIRYGVVQIGPDTPDGVPIVPIKHINRIDSASLHRASPEIESAYAGSRVKGGDVLISVKGTIGAVGVVPGGFEGNIAREIARIRPTSACDADFLALQLEAGHTQRRIDSKIVGSTRLEFSIHAVRDFLVAMPPVPEQRMIAGLLRTWDTAIQKTEQLIAAKERHFAATSHLLLTSRKRLNGFSMKWGLRRADEIFENTSRKGHLNAPLLSVTQQRGVIPRDMLEGRVTMPSGETGAFKLVEPGNFVISLRSFQGGLEHSNYRGLVSPAYTVLKEMVEIDERFFRHYFKSADFIKRLSVAVIGIRDGKQISFQDFCSIKLPFPAVDEQKAIAAFLDEAEGEITLLRKYTAALKTQKRGLMQKLLTGQWRLPVPEEAASA